MKSPLSHGLPQELQLIPCSQYLNLHLRQSCVASLLPYVFYSHWRTFQLYLSSLITDLCCVHCGLLFVHIGISHTGDIILAVSLWHVRVCVLRKLKRFLSSLWSLLFPLTYPVLADSSVTHHYHSGLIKGIRSQACTVEGMLLLSWHGHSWLRDGMGQENDLHTDSMFPALRQKGHRTCSQIGKHEVIIRHSYLLTFILTYSSTHNIWLTRYVFTLSLTCYSSWILNSSVIY